MQYGFIYEYVRNSAWNINQKTILQEKVWEYELAENKSLVKEYPFLGFKFKENV